MKRQKNARKKSMACHFRARLQHVLKRCGAMHAGKMAQEALRIFLLIENAKKKEGAGRKIMAELISRYTALRVDAFKGIALTDTMHKAELNAGGRALAGLRICKSGMEIRYRITITRGNTSRARDVSAFVEFNYTLPNYGGRRLWLVCPHCGRRCSALYLGEAVACRLCLGLYYDCSMESRRDRGWRLHHRWQARTMDGKPKGMHWKTYFELQDKVDRRAMAKLVPLLAVLEKRVKR